MDCIARALLSFAAALFWGFLISVGFQYLFHPTNDASFLFVCLPLTALFSFVFFKKIPEPDLF